MIADRWDIRFLQLAMHIREWSKDPSTKHGTIIVEPSTRRVVGMGYNGFVRGCPVAEDEVERPEKYSRVVHGEMNAMMQAGDLCRGATAYVTSGVGCDRCTVHLLQAGIARFVFLNGNEDYWSRWGEAAEKSLSYINELGIPWQIIEVSTSTVYRSSDCGGA